ncbi:hypothetical protein BJX76DRAFT_369047 [Aspergillus varians]
MEAAGLVLGTLPLLISALEHYEDVSRPTREFFTWRRHRRRLIQELDLWASSAIAESLRETLKVVYDPLKIAIGEIAEILDEIASHLNIQPSQQGTVQLRDIITSNLPGANTPFLKRNFEFNQRILFTMKKKAIKMSLERLEVCTNRIDTWIQRADRISDAGASRTRISFSDSLNTIQDNATRIYWALHQNQCKRILDGECYRNIHRFDAEFRIVETPSSDNEVQVKLSVLNDAFPYDDPSSLPLVKDICQYIQQPAHPIFGFRLDSTESLRVYPSSSTVIPFAGQGGTLRSILPSLRTRLPLEELYCVAITIVASAFQLSHNPWLRPRWGTNDIAFLKPSKSPYSAVDIHYPYLTKEFSIVNTQSDVSTTNDCSSLLSLAILKSDIGNKLVADDMTDLQTTNRWFKGSKACLSHGFQRAILTCLQEYLNPDANLNELDYYNVLKESILLPLEDEMQYIVFGPPR